MDDNLGMNMARKEAERSQCQRRKIGVALFTNGSPVGTHNGDIRSPLPGCACPNRDTCRGMHAEIRALSSYETWGGTQEDLCGPIYSTKAPCSDCVNVLLGTPIKRIVFDTPSNETANREMWEADGREWVQYEG